MGSSCECVRGWKEQRSLVHKSSNSCFKQLLWLYCTWDPGLPFSINSPWAGSSGGSTCLAEDLKVRSERLYWHFMLYTLVPNVCGHVFVSHRLHSWRWCPPCLLERRCSYTSARAASSWSPWTCTYLHCNGKHTHYEIRDRHKCV